MRILAAMLVLAASGPALAAPSISTIAQQPPERIICHRPIKTATRMTTPRACRTESEWRLTRDGRPVDERVQEDADTLATMNERLSGDTLANRRAPE